MQDELEHLLNELDKVNYLTQPQLEEKGIPKDFIFKALKRGLVRFVAETEETKNVEPDESVPISITDTGFQYLNQIRIKKAIEKLDSSINKFNESSDKSSKELIKLTEAIIAFTLVVAAIPLIEKVNQLLKFDSPFYWISGYFIMVITIGGAWIFLYPHLKNI